MSSTSEIIDATHTNPGAEAEEPAPPQPRVSSPPPPSRWSLEYQKIYRLPNHIEPDHAHFKPVELRLGLYTHPELDTTGMDSFKVQVVQKMVGGDHPMASEKWKNFATAVLHDLQGVDALYERSPHPRNPTSTQPEPEELPKPEELLVLDALFLCVYLCHISGKLSALELSDECRETFREDCKEIFRATEFGARRFSLYRDLMVMENQLPMSLMLAVMKQFMDDAKAKDTLNHVLTDVGLAVHPFAHGDRIRNRSQWKEELKLRVNQGHKSTRFDALWTCSHVLASAYIVICGAYCQEEKGDLKQETWWCSRCCKPSARQLQEEAEKGQVDNEEQGKQLDLKQEKDPWWWRCSCKPSAQQLHEEDEKDQADSEQQSQATEQKGEQLPDEQAKGTWRWSCGCKPSTTQQLQKKNEEDLVEDVKLLPSSSSLRKCGIKFKAVDSPFRLDSITFRKGTLWLPKLVMDDHTASLFRNLAMYEQILYEQPRGLSNYDRSDFRYYLGLMDCLIDTPQDVRLLVKAEVLVNHLGSEEDVSNGWNSMCKGLFFSTPLPDYRRSLQVGIDAHLRDRRNRVFAEFRAKYCNSLIRVFACLGVFFVAAATVASGVMAFVAFFVRNPNKDPDQSKVHN